MKVSDERVEDGGNSTVSIYVQTVQKAQLAPR